MGGRDGERTEGMEWRGRRSAKGGKEGTECKCMERGRGEGRRARRGREWRGGKKPRKRGIERGEAGKEVEGLYA